MAETTTATTATSRGILFSDPLVRSILAGVKRQTRRPVRTSRGLWGRRPAPWPDGRLAEVHQRTGVNRSIPCPYGDAGQLLYVKEAHAFLDVLIDHVDRDDPCVVGFRATDTTYRVGRALGGQLEHIDLGRGNAPSRLGAFRWRPSIFCPRWASRLTLELTEVRQELVTEISEADALLEGLESRQAFLDVWARMYRGTDQALELDPRCWVLSFDVVEGAP